MSGPQVNAYTFARLEKPAHLSPSAPADVLSAAWAEAERVRAQAREEGHAAGHAEGIERARAEAAPALAAIEQAAVEIAALREELVETLEGQAAELALRVAEQILAGTVAVEPERVVQVTRIALRRLSDRHRVTVLVNPEDLDVMSRLSDGLRGELGGIDQIDVQSDRRLARGGVIVRTDHGEIDASIATQLQSARELVAAALAGEPDEPAAEPGAAEPGAADPAEPGPARPDGPVALELVDAG